MLTTTAAPHPAPGPTTGQPALTRRHRGCSGRPSTQTQVGALSRHTRTHICDVEGRLVANVDVSCVYGCACWRLQCRCCVWCRHHRCNQQQHTDCTAVCVTLRWCPACTEHEVLPVTEGHRMTLTYNLRAVQKQQWPAPFTEPGVKTSSNNLKGPGTEAGQPDQKVAVFSSSSNGSWMTPADVSASAVQC